MREFGLLLDRWSEAILRADRRAAVIAVTIANRHRGKHERTHKLEDFLIHRAAPRERKSSAHHRQSREEQINIAAQLTTLLGGIVALPKGV